MSVVIRVDNVSKKYHLGKVGTKTLKGDLQRWWANMRGKDDPYAKVGSTGKPNSEEFWALNSINFEIKQGEAVGIIGKNGAGKSTLLKILSRITTPTTGNIKIRGRIASLLEVGTGFNPELSGRENIFLNGAILGMTKREVKAKFDEIVDFSGVEKFIDTPVKRYSSGMYVRLAFAVAAHLDSEILILDEVLAVGDSEFQKKCLGKMDDVAHKQGRTVIFVSHDMAAVNKLCQRAILLKEGSIFLQGTTSIVIDRYLQSNNSVNKAEVVWHSQATAPGNETAKIHSIKILKSGDVVAHQAYLDEPLYIEVQYWCLKPNAVLNVSVSLFTSKNEYVFASASTTDSAWYRKPHPRGLFKAVCKINGNFLNEGRYTITGLLIGDSNQLVAQVDHAIAVEMVDLGKERGDYFGYWGGVVRPLLEWQTEFISEKILS